MMTCFFDEKVDAECLDLSPYSDFHCSPQEYSSRHCSPEDGSPRNYSDFLSKPCETNHHFSSVSDSDDSVGSPASSAGDRDLSPVQCDLLANYFMETGLLIMAAPFLEDLIQTRVKIELELLPVVSALLKDL